MLLEALEPLHHGLCDDLSLQSPSPCSSPPSSLLPSPAYTPCSSAHSFHHTFFQFPPPHDDGRYTDNIAVKEEPWSESALDLAPMGLPAHQPTAVPAAYNLTADSYSPMLMSPAPSNLNTPRVSLSSHHSDFSARLRSCHSSLQCSPHASPLGFAWDLQGGGGGFGPPSLGGGLPDLGGAAHMDLSASSPLEAGYITPPRSGYSSPQPEEEREPGDYAYHSHHQDGDTSAAPPSYDQTMHHQLGGCCYPPYLEGPESPYLPPPYPYGGEMSGGGGPPAYTPDPESSLLSERDQEPPDTPDSSVKEEPSEEISEEGAAICRYTHSPTL